MENLVFSTENVTTSVTTNIDDYDTPIDGTFDYEDIDEKDLESDSNLKGETKATGATASKPSSTKGNFYSKSPQPHPPTSATENYESPIPTLSRVRE